MTIWHPSRHIFLEDLNAPEPWSNCGPGLGQFSVSPMSPDQRNEIRKIGGLRHSNYQCFATSAIAAACTLHTERLRHFSRLGVVTTAGPMNLVSAWESGERQLREGPRFINPIIFPHTIVSSVPTSLAAHLGATEFAISVGGGYAAFWNAVRRASMLICEQYADQVFLGSSSDATELCRVTAEKIGLNLHDFTSAILVSPIAGDRSVQLNACIESRSAMIDIANTLKIDRARIFGVQFVNGVCVDSTQGSLLESYCALSATGGVLFYEGIACSDIGRPLLVGVRENGVFRGVVVS